MTCIKGIAHSMCLPRGEGQVAAKVDEYEGLLKASLDVVGEYMGHRPERDHA